MLSVFMLCTLNETKRKANEKKKTRKIRHKYDFLKSNLKNPHQHHNNIAFSYLFPFKGISNDSLIGIQV